MNTKLTTTIDMIDNKKLIRMATRAGLSRTEAFRVIATKGVAFFLALVAGATK